MRNTTSPTTQEALDQAIARVLAAEEAYGQAIDRSVARDFSPASMAAVEAAKPALEAATVALHKIRRNLWDAS